MAHPKIANTDHDVHELIRHRWSPRAFDATREVARADLLRLFEAARWAPSSGNEQPWRFLVGDRTRLPSCSRRCCRRSPRKNQAWAGRRRCSCWWSVRLTLERNESVNPMAWYDAGQAVALLTIQATAQGLAIRQMAGFDREHARRGASCRRRSSRPW